MVNLERDETRLFLAISTLACYPCLNSYQNRFGEESMEVARCLASRSGSRTVVFFGLFSVSLLAQTPDTATIHGHILDQSRGAVSGAEISLTKAGSPLKRTARTDQQGDFTVTSLPVDGNYTITATKAGFAPAKQAGIALEGGTAADINIQLNVASGSAKITVTGSAGEIRTDAPQLGDRIAGRQLQETPMLDRSHHMAAPAELRQPPRHQSGRYLYQSKSLYYERRGPTPNLVRSRRAPPLPTAGVGRPSSARFRSRQFRR